MLKAKCKKYKYEPTISLCTSRSENREECRN